MIGAALCFVGHHSPNRRKVWNDGLDFRSSCVGCGRPMIRSFHGWRLFDNDRDALIERDAKPQRRADGGA